MFAADFLSASRKEPGEDLCGLGRCLGSDFEGSYEEAWGKSNPRGKAREWPRGWTRAKARGWLERKARGEAYVPGTKPHGNRADFIHKNMAVAKHIGVTKAVMKLGLCLSDPQGCTNCFGHVLAEKTSYYIL